MPSAIERYNTIKQYLFGNQDPTDLEALKAAEERAAEERQIAGIGSGLDKIISSIGKTQASPDVYVNMQKVAGEGPSRVREYLKQKYEQKKDAGHTAAQLAQADATSEATQSQREFQNQLAKENLSIRKSQEAREEAKGSIGQQAADRKQAEEAAEWASAGRSGLQSGVARLEEVAKRLENEEDSVLERGRARLGADAALSSVQLKNKQDVLNAVIPALKSFGSNPTEGERRALIESIYDPKLSPSDNVKNIRSTIAEWQAKGEVKDSLARKYFPGIAESKKEMAPPPTAPNDSRSIPPGMKLQVNIKTGETRLVPK